MGKKISFTADLILIGQAASAIQLRSPGQPRPRQILRSVQGGLLKAAYQLAVILLAAALSLARARPVQGQGSFEVKDAQVVVNFGEQITFTARLVSSIPIEQASILFREVNEEVTRVETLQVGENGLVSFRYDASKNILPPFSTVVFWYQATLSDGQTYTSDLIRFRYDDNRFPWRESSSGPVTVHWYDGDDAFGQAALDTAGQGLLSVNEVIPLSFDTPVDIYIYSNAGDLQGALELGGESWVGGHANPKIGVVMVSVAPGTSQFTEMETEIPHELAHVMLYRALGDGYDDLPVWLSEGIAGMVELYPNPEYSQALKNASQNDSLLHFGDLCKAFPPDSGRAFLAYAESQSFTAYLRATYGLTGLSSLISAYEDGLDCELGATRALNTPLNQLEARWRESVLGENAAGVAARNLSPYLVLMILVLLVPIWGAIDILRARRKRVREQK